MFDDKSVFIAFQDMVSYLRNNLFHVAEVHHHGTLYYVITHVDITPTAALRVITSIVDDKGNTFERIDSTPTPVLVAYTAITSKLQSWDGTVQHFQSVLVQEPQALLNWQNLTGA